MKTLQELFENTLQDVYYAEKSIVKALPKMAQKASTEELSEAFTKHLEETKGQVERLEQIFDILGKPAKGKKCPAIEGILEEGEEIMKEAKEPSVRDAGMIGAAQAVEHYEIARYGTLVAWAEALELDDVKDLLEETLEEEKNTDEALSDLSETMLMPEGKGAVSKALAWLRGE